GDRQHAVAVGERVDAKRLWRRTGEIRVHVLFEFAITRQRPPAKVVRRFPSARMDTGTEADGVELVVEGYGQLGGAEGQVEIIGCKAADGRVVEGDRLPADQVQYRVRATLRHRCADIGKAGEGKALQIDDIAGITARAEVDDFAVAVAALHDK